MERELSSDVRLLRVEPPRDGDGRSDRSDMASAQGTQHRQVVVNHGTLTNDELVHRKPNSRKSGAVIMID